MSIRSFKTADGLRLSFSDDGGGIPLLCLAGLTRNMDDFQHALRELVHEARIIRLDTRGRGGSDNATDFTQYNIQREGLDAVELLDHLGLSRAVILGTSRGGLIAMGLASSHRDRLAGVILNDIGPVIDAAGLTRIMGYLGVKPDFSTHDEAADNLCASLSGEFPGVPRERWLEHARSLWSQGSTGLNLRYDPALRRALLEGTVPMPDLWAGFRALNGLPVAVIRGANSDLLSAATVAEMRAANPALYATEVPDRGHVPFLDEPESLAAIRHVLAKAKA